MRKLPWSTDEYVKLDPLDLLPERPPTEDQRVRVAAALATLVRDNNMLGIPIGPNAETVRIFLTMDAASWKRHIGSLQGAVFAYDPVDGGTRFDQTCSAIGKK